MKYLILASIFPSLLALGLWLIGIPMDWSNWKTYAGLLAITVAVAVA